MPYTAKSLPPINIPEHYVLSNKLKSEIQEHSFFQLYNLINSIVFPKKMNLGE